MITAQISIIATILLYLIVMLYVGFYFSRKGGNASSSEFYLGGRKLGPIVTAMSAEASDMSSWLLMGLPGLAYLSGIAEPAWTAFGLALGTYFNWLIVAKRLRCYSMQSGAITLPEFFSHRYRDERHMLAGAAALVILIFFIPYTASGFKAIGTLFSSLLGVDYHCAMIAGAGVILVYTLLGGFMAISMTDLIQSLVMSAALLVIVSFGIHQAGGWSEVLTRAQELPGYLTLLQSHNSTTGTAQGYGSLNLISTLAWGLGYFGMPHILLRFMAIENEHKLATSRRIASIWVVLSMVAAILIGIVGFSVSATGKIPFLATSSSAETILMELAHLLSQHGLLAASVAGIVLVGILACTMSTADSQLLIAASSVSQDLLQGVFRLKLSARTSMKIARATVLTVALIAVFLAWNPNSSVFAIVAFAWAGFGAAFGPVVLFALFWKRSNRWGALAGILTGTLMTFIWKYSVSGLGGVWSIYELLPAFIAACAAIIIVSLLTAAPSAEVCEEFEKVKNKGAGY